MAIAGLATYQNRSMSYTVRNCVRDFNSDKGNAFMNQTLSFCGKEGETVQEEDGNAVNAGREIDSELRFGSVQGYSPVGKYGETKPYTRCITASIKTREMTATEADGQMIYSYQEEEKSFNIFINSDGTNKTYTIKGIDENGQEIEEEFDPYNLDPEMMDFPEFSALCMYIRQTDDTADLMTKLAFTDTRYFDNLFEKGDRINMLKDYSEECRETDQYFSKLASSLFDAINDFFDRTIWNSGINDEELSLLFADLDDIETQEKISAIKNGYTYSDTTTDAVSETIVSKHNQYTDPDTGEIVPVNIKYITAYTEQGISCKEISDVGGKISQRDLWSLSYDSPDCYEKVQEFLKSFSKDQNLTFAPQEKFWKDFMNDDFDIDGFRAYYDSTDNGKIDVEKALKEGRKLGDVLTEPYAEYINNTHFIGKVFTEQEMWDNWYAQIEASQKAALANGSGMEPPTEIIISSDSNIRAVNGAGEPYGRSRVEMLVKQYGEDSSYAKALRALEQSFDATFSNIPDHIKDDWIEMCIDSGVNQITGMSLDGKSAHLSQIMIQKCVNDYNLRHGNYQYVDFGWGKSVESLIRILNKGIHDIDHPLPGQPEHSESVKKLIAKERSFYQSFLEKMGW